MPRHPLVCALPRWTSRLGLPILIVAGIVLATVGKAVPDGEAELQVLAVQDGNVLGVSVLLSRPDGGKLHGNLKVELVDSRGKALDSKEMPVRRDDPSPAYRVDLNPAKRSLDDLKLLVSFGMSKVESPVKHVLLLKGHETALVCGTQFHPGTTTTLHCTVQGVRSLTETIPLRAASIEVRLTDSDGKSTLLFKGKTDAAGVVAPRIAIPNLPVGEYVMDVLTTSTLGHESVERKVHVKDEAKILLTTDRPLYQPGQVIHMRALCLRAFDRKPVAGEIVFEVEDGKGNKVFKHEQKTSAYGVAAADFTLASEVNQGDYHVRAVLGEKHVEKTVVVKPFVLPKFKVEVTTDRKFYGPRDTIKADLQADYFFAKPVAGGKYRIRASTWDGEFTPFQTVEGKTDAQGHARLEITLPDRYVGKGIAGGNGLVKLEAVTTDTADQVTTTSTTVPVADKPIKVTLLPEGGRLVPDVENRVYVVALGPDGTPVRCAVQVSYGDKGKNPLIGKVRTGADGVADFRFTPDASRFRMRDMRKQFREMLGGEEAPTMSGLFLLDLKVVAQEDNGPKVETREELGADFLGENVLLRLDRAIFKSGEPIAVDVISTTKAPTVHLSVIKEGQVLQSRLIDVRKGKASHKLELPAEIHGPVEIHVHQSLPQGLLISDARVVYVQPANDLKIRIQADKDVHRPGEEGKIRFEVTDSDDKPVTAALGVFVVDEAVYALQDLKPGLEKVFFSLLQGPSKPVRRIGEESLDALVKSPERGLAVQAMLSAIQPKLPADLHVDPAALRSRDWETRLNDLATGLLTTWAWGHATNPPVVRDPETKAMKFSQETLRVQVLGGFEEGKFLDPFGRPVLLSELVRYDKEFTPENLARAVTVSRMQTLVQEIIRYSEAEWRQWYKDGKWDFPADLLEQLPENLLQAPTSFEDAWGGKFRFESVKKKRNNKTPWTQFNHHHLVSAGPDGKFGTADDVTMESTSTWRSMNGLDAFGTVGWMRGFGGLGDGAIGAFGALGGGALGALGGGALGGAFGLPMQVRKAPAPTRVRELFPETLLWKPMLITDDKGKAVLTVPFADSITTWRMSASASSLDGRLAGASAPLRVFQDFFIDLDLPVALTMSDEVSFPVAVFNYLKEPQTVKLQLVEETWFELVEGRAERTLDIKPNEVTSVKFRIRAKKPGHHPLTLKAVGSKTSDALKRFVEVVPDGRLIEQVVNGRLSGGNSHVIAIPRDSIDGASRLVVKVHPGVFSQVLEGAGGMLRMPGGCFEQTSSSAYPNVLVVDYLKKTRTGSAATLKDAEQFLNVGHQRLLTFERPGGGFDWWGTGTSLVWLSAFGLQEFSDMAKVWPVDRGVIDRTRIWLLKQQEANGTWSNIGETHGESIERMGDPKLLLTSYVVWSLCEAGYKGEELRKSIDFIRAGAKKADNTYILALAANALASWDAKDPGTLEVLKKLVALKKELPGEKSICFIVPDGRSLSHARGDALTVETTALAALAMMKADAFHADASRSLMFLVKSKDSHGTWGSTQATVLSLKALVAGAGVKPMKETAKFVVRIAGKQVAESEITPKNGDVMQIFDLKEYVKTGPNEVTIETKGETTMLYQIVARHYEPWKQDEKKPILDVKVDYDRLKLSTSDMLKATATLKYNGSAPTYQVIVDLGIPPGFTVDAGEFAAMVAAKKVERFEVAGRQVILYLGNVKPGAEMTFAYGLKPKYPVKAKTPATVVYEYYTPTNRAESTPVELTVSDAK